jgi:tripartite-type tricarboxylate transporter receptor subunit TctC
MVVTNWFGAFGPARLPRELLTKLHRSIVDIMHSADGRTKFTALSLDIAATTPQEFEAHLKAELEKWGRVVKAAGIKPE